MDSREYRLQLDGLAAALRDAEVRSTLLAMPSAPVAVSIFEWSGRNSQRLLVDWRFLRTDADIDALAAILHGTARQKMSVSTGIGAALRLAGQRQAAAPACGSAVLDISGDGKNNDGPRPQDIGTGTIGTLRVNALVIGAARPAGIGAQAMETDQLVDYFRVYVIRGPDAFVEVAVGYDDYAKAMKRKLLRELDVIVLGEATLAPPPSASRTR